MPIEMLSGKDTPLMENGAGTEGAEEIVTVAFDAVRVTVCVSLLPTVTFPKLIQVGETESSGGAVDDFPELSP